MRHNRRAVMTEHYKLYMKKHVFNGKYFVRNLQIGVGTLALAALLGGMIAITDNGQSDSGATDTKMTIKEALFGAEEEENTLRVESTQEVLEYKTEEQVVEEELAENELAENEIDTEQDTTAAEVVSEAKVEEEAAPESEFDGKCIANVEESLNIRTQPDKDSEFAGCMNAGAIAKVLGTDGEWTKIQSGDVEGYVLSEYVLCGKEAEELAAKHVSMVGTVLEDGVNVRAEKSTDADILKVVNKDTTISVLAQEESADEEQEVVLDAVTEEAKEETQVEEFATKQSTKMNSITEAVSEYADAQVATQEDVEESSSITEAVEDYTENQTKTEEQVDSVSNAESTEWVAVMLEDGQVGYVAADFIEVEKLYELAISAEEIERKAAEEEAARKAAEEEAVRQAAEREAAQQQQQVPTSQNSSSTSGQETYQGAKTTPVTATASGESLGTFTITAYCGCSKCSGGHNRTSTGTVPTEGRTIAADPNVLPYGTQVVIGGVVYTVEDCGSGVSGNHIDIFFATHESALAYGRRTVEVYKY